MSTTQRSTALQAPLLPFGLRSTPPKSYSPCTPLDRLFHPRTSSGSSTVTIARLYPPTRYRALASVFPLPSAPPRRKEDTSGSPVAKRREPPFTRLSLSRNTFRPHEKVRVHERTLS